MHAYCITFAYSGLSLHSSSLSFFSLLSIERQLNGSNSRRWTRLLSFSIFSNESRKERKRFISGMQSTDSCSQQVEAGGRRRSLVDFIVGTGVVDVVVDELSVADHYRLHHRHHPSYRLLSSPSSSPCR